VLQVARNLVDALHTGKSGGDAPRARDARDVVLAATVLFLGACLFLGHATAYSAWLIDDAGISIAYATNFAHGLGFVSQPGAPPVEGFTDALWVLLLAVFARAGALAVPVTVKILGATFVVASYATLLAIVRRTAVHPILVGSAVLVFCSVNPSFVIWCMSGLENALYTFTILLLAYATLRALEADQTKKRPLVLCGLAAVLVATTRPDGILFAILPPAIVFATRLDGRSRERLAAYALAFGGPMAIFILARLILFHHLVPNTYVAKGGVRLGDALEFAFLMPNGVHKLEALLEAAFAGIVTNGVLVAALVAARILFVRGRFDARLASVIAFAFVALADFMLLPKDRMEENRFATPFYPLYYASAFSLLDVALDVPAVRRKRLAVGALVASLLIACAPDFSGRALVFARAPSIGLFYVRRAFAERIDRYAEALHIATAPPSAGASSASVLLPDVGGMLLWSHLRVVDLAGLCDERIARTLFRDPPATREYILGEVRPTFIHAADIWAKAAALEEDPRFSSDYTPIHAYSSTEDPPSDGHAAGLFVRRDALGAAGDDASLQTLRGESHVRLGFLPPPRDSLLLRWLDATSLVPAEYRARLAMILREKPAETSPREAP
jgi:hypothetical protein